MGSGLPAHVDVADLIQCGIFGLVDAIERFEPDRGRKFEVYAMQRIRGAILDELRSMDWAPRQARNWARKLENAGRDLDDEALRESERRHRVVVRNLPGVSVALYDRWLRCVLSDGRTAGVAGENGVGRFLHELVEPEVLAVLEPVFDIRPTAFIAALGIGSREYELIEVE